MIIEFSDQTRTYSTRSNLIKALDRLDLTKFRPLVAKHEDRFTAVFSSATARSMGVSYMGFAAQHGFMTI